MSTNEPWSQEPKRDPPQEKKQGENVDQIVNELRQVLAGLQAPKPLEPSLPDALRLDEEKKEMESSPLPNPPVEIPPLEFPPPEPAPQSPSDLEPAVPPQPSSGDSDFWQGNVMGWPTSFKEGMGEEKEASVGKHTSTELGLPLEEMKPKNESHPVVQVPHSVGEDIERVDLESSKRAPPGGPHPDLVSEKHRMEGQENEKEIVLPPLPDDVPIAKDFNASAVEPSSLLSGVPVSGYGFSDDLIPPPPLSPLDKDRMKEPFNYDPAKKEFDFPSKDLPPQKLTVSLNPPLAQRPLKEPIEPTKSPVEKFPTKEIPSSTEIGGVDFDIRAMKTEGVIQIACVFPKGLEMKGQRFVSKLKIAASKKEKPLDIQTVFTLGWPEGNVDVPSWTKSAKLSGADYLFILAFKKDQRYFPGLSKTMADQRLHCRLIFVEQLDLLALYADILAELINNGNGRS